MPTSEDVANTVITLTDLSPKDKTWDVTKAVSKKVSDIYSSSVSDLRKGERVSDCSGFLGFDEIVDDKTGEVGLRLSQARFCRVRLCPVCQWRRSLFWKARFYQVLPKIMADNPKSRFLFLTLTVRNCEVENLRETMKLMTKAWSKLTRRKVFEIVQGWVRTTEITRGKDGSAHPHFHVLLMVPSGYFAGHSYIKQVEWVRLWKSCLKIDYEPNVDIRTVKNKSKKEGDIPLPVAGLKEVLKYAVKPADMIADKSWFLEMSRQISGTRAIALGGYLADVLKDHEQDMPDDEDLIHLGEDDENEEQADNVVEFFWRDDFSKYVFVGKKKKQKKYF